MTVGVHQVGGAGHIDMEQLEPGVNIFSIFSRPRVNIFLLFKTVPFGRLP